MKYLLPTALLATSSYSYIIDSGKSDDFETVAKDKLDNLGVSQNKFDNHGCWAARLMGGKTDDYLDAPSPRLDDIDGYIRDWHAARRCTQKPGGNCAGGIDSETYNFKSNNGCDDITDSCLNALCLIDDHYANLVKDADSGFSNNAPDAVKCNSTEDAHQCDYCSGVAPDLTCGPIPAPSVECAGKAADIWLAIDGSASVKLDRFNKLRAHIVSFLEDMDIGPDNMHVGVSQWAKATRVEFNYESDKIKVLSEVGPMQYMNEGCGICTQTGKALNHAYNQIMANKRSNVPQFLVTFTDGKAHDTGAADRNQLGLALNGLADAVTPALNKIEAAGIKAFAIGVGKGTLQSHLDRFITSDGRSWRLPGEDAFDALGDIIHSIAATVCTSVTP